MSDNQQTPNPLKRILIVLIAAIVVGTLWFVWQSRSNTTKTLDNTKKAQPAETTASTTDQYKGWKSYTWANHGVSFKYPDGWFVSENADMGRLYVKNSQVDLLTAETPDNFQQVWLSNDTSEASLARENAIKKGLSDFRTVSGTVKASTIKADGVTVNTYEYQTTGGSTLEAYWTNKAGKRFLATTSTDVGKQNQTDMVATLKKLLSSLSLAN